MLISPFYLPQNGKKTNGGATGLFEGSINN